MAVENPVAHAAEVRRKYVEAFNENMIKIWKERVVLLQVIDTGALYSSIVPLKFTENADASDVSFDWGFNEYGIYQDRGTGREVAIGNPGDIGRPKVREVRKWMSSAFYSSTMNIKEFLADSLGFEAMGIFGNILGAKPVAGSIS